MFQVWFSENINPLFTNEDKNYYRHLIENQFYRIGNAVNGRQLLRCMTDDFTPIENYLNSLGKQVIICGMRDENQDWVGAKNQVEFDKFTQPVSVLDYDGNPVMVTPADNTTAGWLAFNDPNPNYVAEGNIITPTDNTSADWLAFNDPNPNYVTDI